MMLLSHDDLVFDRVARRWRPSPGSSQWQGRFLFIPHLLAPWRPLVRGANPNAPSAIPHDSSPEPDLNAWRTLDLGASRLVGVFACGSTALPLTSPPLPHFLVC